MRADTIVSPSYSCLFQVGPGSRAGRPSDSAPARNSRGGALVRSMIVEAVPPGQRPPSRTSSTRPSSSCSASVSRGGGGLSRAVGAGDRQRASGASQQGQRQGVVGHAHGDAIPARAQFGRHALSSGNHERQRAGPKAGDAAAKSGGKSARDLPPRPPGWPPAPVWPSIRGRALAAYSRRQRLGLHRSQATP